MSIYFVFSLVLFNITSVQAGRVLITLYALKLGAQPFTIGLLAALYSVLPMLLSVQVGRLSDRFGSRWLLMFGSVGGAVGMLVPYFSPGLPALYTAALSNGIVLTCASSTLQSLVGRLSRPEESVKNFNNYSLLVSFTGLVGPLFAGFSLDRTGPDNSCMSLVLFTLVPLVMLAFWGSRLPGGARSAKHVGSVRELLSESGLWRVMVTSSLVLTGIDLFQIYMPIYGYSIRLSASEIGLVLSIFSLAAFFIRLILPLLLKRFTVERVLAYAFLLGAFSFALMPFSKNIVLLMLLSFMFGLGMGCGQPITMMLTYSHSTHGRTGEAMGLRVTVNHFTRVVVPIIFGSIGSVFGLFPVFWVNALILASGGAVARSRASGSRQKG
jgi:MFS family permease